MSYDANIHALKLLSCEPWHIVFKYKILQSIQKIMRLYLAAKSNSRKYYDKQQRKLQKCWWIVLYTNILFKFQTLKKLIVQWIMKLKCLYQIIADIIYDVSVIWSIYHRLNFNIFHVLLRGHKKDVLIRGRDLPKADASVSFRLWKAKLCRHMEKGSKW